MKFKWPTARGPHKYIHKHTRTPTARGPHKYIHTHNTHTHTHTQTHAHTHTYIVLQFISQEIQLADRERDPQMWEGMWLHGNTVCDYLHMYVRVCARVCMCTFIFIYAWEGIWLQGNKLRVYIYIYVCVCVCMRVCTRMRACV